MYQTQKRLIGIMGLVFLGIFIHVSTLTTLTRNASADYTVTAGQKCDDGKDPTVVPGATPTYNCTGDRSTAQQTNPGGTQVGGAPTATNDNETTCAVERIGWLLCPIIQGAGKMADKAFQFLSNNFLETEPELVSSTPDKGTQYAWNIARNLANIMFIVAFLIIIYSQVTGAGITNYGIKKMLPRLIVAAIAVNASYYICQIIVDLTNIMGREIQSFMVDTARGITTNAAMPMGGSFIFGKDSPGTLETIISGVLGLSIVWIFLPFLLLGSGTILITCIILIVILLMRKAFVVLLIVAAPVAFVAYLLPNTEKYFQKWLSMFWKLLLVFPIVGMLMGGGQLASAIILATGSHSTATYSDTGEKCVQLATHTTAGSSITSCNGGSVPFLLGLTAAVIAVAPLLAVGAVLKGALSAAGAIGGKIAGAVETYTKKGGEWGTKNTAIGRGMAARKAIKQNYKDQKFAGRMSRTGKNASAYDKYTQLAARGITGNIGQLANHANIEQLGGLRAQDSKLSANFAGAADKIEAQEMSEKQSALNRETGGDMNKIQQRLQEAVERGDEMGAKAAQNLLFGMGGAGVDAFVKGMDGAGKKASGDIINSLQQNIRLHHGNIKSTSAGVSHWATGDGQGGALLSESMNDAKAYSNLSAEQFASQSGETLSAMSTAMKTAMTTYGDTTKTQTERDAAKDLAQGIVNGAHAAKNSKAFESVKVSNKTAIEDLSLGKYK